MAADLPSSAYELSAAVTRALQTGNAEAKWLAGEDVFAGIAEAPRNPPVLDQAIKVIAAEIANMDIKFI